jgi:hypothetical protein
VRSLQRLSREPASVSHPTGDLEGDRNVTFTKALDCLDEFMFLLPSNTKGDITAALSELAVALSDLNMRPAYAIRFRVGDPHVVHKKCVLVLLTLRANIDCTPTQTIIDITIEAAAPRGPPTPLPSPPVSVSPVRP